jgi:hypothetical protein
VLLSQRREPLAREVEVLEASRERLKKDVDSQRSEASELQSGLQGLRGKLQQAEQREKELERRCLITRIRFPSLCTHTHTHTPATPAFPLPSNPLRARVHASRGADALLTCVCLPPFLRCRELEGEVGARTKGCRTRAMRAMRAARAMRAGRAGRARRARRAGRAARVV